MINPSARFALVVLLPEKYNAIINPVRESFEKGVSQRIPPHISVTSPFWIIKEKPFLYEKITKVLLTFPSFTASIEKPAFFSPKVLYLAVSPVKKFAQINNKLETLLATSIKIDSSFFNNQSLPPYIPHITISLSASVQKLSFVEKKLSPLIGQKFPVNKVILLKDKKSSKHWKAKHLFLLRA